MQTKTHSRFSAYYSLCCGLLGLGFIIDSFFTIENFVFGWQYRFLTIWGLNLATIAHGMLARWRFMNKPIRFKSLISAIAILNCMVIFLYWRLYFIDPGLVNDGTPPVFIREYYLHLIGPLAMTLEALTFDNYFKYFWQGIGLTILICMIYVAWLELIIEPYSILPYPFLRTMPFDERGMFYFQTIITAVVFFVCLAVINKAVVHIKRRKQPS